MRCTLRQVWGFTTWHSIRQALTMAIDRETLVKVLGRGEQAAFGIVPPGVANHVSAHFSWENMTADDRQAAAQDLLRQAGYDDDHPLHFRLTYDTGDVHETVALAVSSMWQDVLGIEVGLDKKEWKYFLATREDRSAWQVMRFAWIGDYNDPGTFTDIFRSDSQQNLPGYSIPNTRLRNPCCCMITRLRHCIFMSASTLLAAGSKTSKTTCLIGIPRSFCA
jgi:oligopeptide transport system substrate-binding protein